MLSFSNKLTLNLSLNIVGIGIGGVSLRRFIRLLFL
jgi:hypothetical protein